MLALKKMGKLLRTHRSFPQRATPSSQRATPALEYPLALLSQALGPFPPTKYKSDAPHGSYIVSSPEVQSRSVMFAARVPKGSHEMEVALLRDY